MENAAQSAKATLLRHLHQGPPILVLPNAWDAASARVFELAGFPAVATTSAGIAASLGYPDGQRISRDEMLQMVRRIVEAVSVPVTADLEAGYGETAADMAATVRALLATGAVGLNLEDARADGTLYEIPAQVAKIRAVCEAGQAAGVPLVTNARTDVYLAGIGEPSTRFEHAVRRLSAYREAGADCLFVPGVRDAETIGRLVQALGGPVNILATAGAPAVPELATLGVARVSVGSGPMRACLGLVQRIARELRQTGTYGSFTEGALPYAEVNRMLERGSKAPAGFL